MNQGIQSELAILRLLTQEPLAPDHRRVLRQQAWLLKESGVLPPPRRGNAGVGTLAILLGLALPASAQDFVQYTIQPGDTMWGIAERYLGHGARWKVIAYHNPQFRNPRRIFAWRKIKIPVTRVAKVSKIAKVTKRASGQSLKISAKSVKKGQTYGPPLTLAPNQRETLRYRQLRPVLAQGTENSKKPVPRNTRPVYAVEPQFVILSLNGEYKKVVEIIKTRGQRFVHWETMADIAQLKRLQENRFIREWDGKQGAIDPKEHRVVLEGRALGEPMLTYKGEWFLAESALGKLLDSAVRWPADSSILTIESKHELRF